MAMTYASTGVLGGHQGEYAGNQVAPVPRSLSSAAGKIEALNQRLAEIRNLANALADQIGGPRPANGIGGATAQTEPIGAVARLNDAADSGHTIISDLEETLKSISRALG